MATTLPTRAHELYLQARRSLAGGVSSSFRAAVTPEPLFVDHGEGAYVIDVDGARHLDCTLAWGPLILGHSHPAVVTRVTSQLTRGHMYGAQHELEGRLAERLVAAIPCADLVTYANSGTEAAMVALRLARAYTGRSRVVKFEGHYHGWSDSMLISYHADPAHMGPRSAPIPVLGTAGQVSSGANDVLVAPWNDLAALETLLAGAAHDVAAVIMEPVLCNSGVIAPEPGYLEEVAALCDRYRIVLIFDEVITGFRLAFGGAQEVYGVIPDIAIYAKAVAAGFPLSVIAGRRPLMELIAAGTVAHSGTYNGNPISLAAAAAALDELSGPGVYEHLNRIGAALAEGARAALARRNLRALVHQAGPVMQIHFTDQQSVRDYRAFRACDAALTAALTRELRARNVLIVPDGRWYLSVVHTLVDVRVALEALDDSLGALTA